MRPTNLRKSTLALALGAVIAASAFGAAPVLAQGSDGDDTRQNTLDARMFNNAQSFTATTTYYPTPAYVPVPAPAQTATTYTTTSPVGTTTTTTYANPGVAYVPSPVPSYSATTVVTQKPCNSWDVPRPGVTTACPY